MNTRTKEIAGSLAVSAGLTVGTNAHVSGSAHIAHSMRVDGYLDAPNLTTSGKGLFLDIDELRAAYPNPKAGDYALTLECSNPPDDEHIPVYKNLAYLVTTRRANNGKYIWHEENLPASIFHVDDVYLRDSVETNTEAIDNLNTDIEDLHTFDDQAKDRINALHDRLESTVTKQYQDNLSRVTAERELRNDIDNLHHDLHDETLERRQSYAELNTALLAAQRSAANAAAKADNTAAKLQTEATSRQKEDKRLADDCQDLHDDLNELHHDLHYETSARTAADQDQAADIARIAEQADKLSAEFRTLMLTEIDKGNLIVWQ